jgi:hypothetical protein
MSGERSGRKSSQAVAVCGESRMHGGNGGDGKTQFGCASCLYPLKSGEELFEIFMMFFPVVDGQSRSQYDATGAPAASRGLATT